MAAEKPKEEENKLIAILSVGGNLETVAAVSIPALRKVLKNYPASALVEVWRGRKLKLKKEVKVSF